MPEKCNEQTRHPSVLANSCVFVAFRHVKGRVMVALADGTVAIFHRDLGKEYTGNPFIPFMLITHNTEATFVESTNFCPEHKDAKIFENHLKPVMLVFIGKLSLNTLRWVPICQGFSHFSGFLRHFVLAKLDTSSIRVNTPSEWVWFKMNSLYEWATVKSRKSRPPYESRPL